MFQDLSRDGVGSLGFIVFQCSNSSMNLCEGRWEVKALDGGKSWELFQNREINQG